jgi:rubrerythrin
MLKQDARNVVQLLMDHELALKELYQAYATALPSLKGLWSKLAADEQRHADWLDSLGPEVGSTPRPGPQGWPRPAAIESSLKYVRAQILRARQAQVTTLTALAVAKDLESALLEKEFFKVVDGAVPEVRAVFDRLVIATEIHWRTVADALDAAKRTPAAATQPEPT